MLEGSEISRILPVNDSGSAVKIRDLSTGPGFEVRRPAVLLAKIGVCSVSFDFSPHFSYALDLQ